MSAMKMNLVNVEMVPGSVLLPIDCIIYLFYFSIELGNEDG
jgi:hypothetical protein